MSRFLVAALLFLFALPVQADAFDMRYFSNIPVAHDGRIKPLGRFAAALFSDISGRHVRTHDAAALLAVVLFEPVRAVDMVLFHIPDPAIQKKLGLHPAQDSRYAFTAVHDGFVRLGDRLDRNDNTLMTLYASAVAFEQLKDGLVMVLPLRGSNGPSMLDMARDNPLTQSLLGRGSNNNFLRVIPHGDEWVAPWVVFLDPVLDLALLRDWEKLARAYVSGDMSAWSDITTILRNKHMTPMMLVRFWAENAYASVNPYGLSVLLYALAFCLVLLPFAVPMWVALGPLAAGIAAHGAGLGFRMVILGRPPVTDLYESVLFVGFITVTAMAVMAWRLRATWMLAAGAVIGVLLHVMGFFLADDAGNLRVLAAVLDTKFWLAVHVLVITGGYGACLVTAALAHVTLGLGIMGRSTTALYQHTVYAAVFSLFLVVLGTILGGVWADQSWGRFWGWDPKENGALLIILWLTWLLHGRVTGQISKTGMSIGLAALVSVVGISWVGVNTLGVGLHSYGFMGGLAFGLALVIFLQAISLFYMWRRINHNGCSI